MDSGGTMDAILHTTVLIRINAMAPKVHSILIGLEYIQGRSSPSIGSQISAR